MERLISLLGLVVLIGLAWLMSKHKRKVSLRIIFIGLALQITFALLVLKTTPGQQLFETIGTVFNQLLIFVDQGAMFVFGINPRQGDPALPPNFLLVRSFAFGVLPSIIFFSALMSLLYHFGVMQFIVKIFAVVMQKTLNTSGAESLSTAANIFVGQTEAPLIIRPYVATMTLSELMAVMVGGFATVAGGVMAAYVSFGIDAGHLMAASVISAPATLVIAKIMQPEVDEPQTRGRVILSVEHVAANALEAVAIGASDGLKLALNVGAMLIAFLAMIAMFNAMIGWAGSWFGWQWSLEAALGYLFAPFAWLLGVESKDCFKVGELLGIRMAANEFVSYVQLGEMIKTGEISKRSVTITTYALCGFANFSSIGIQIGGIGAMAPTRQGDLARLGLRAMLGGTLACFMTACVAGMLIND